MEFYTFLVSLACGCASLDGLFKGDGKKVVTSDGQCLALVPESPSQGVLACENAARYTLRAGEWAKSYEKTAFRKQLRERVVSFVRGTAYPVAALKDATLEVWIEAPLFGDAEAALAVVVRAPAGNFVAALPLDADHWQMSPEAVTWLGREAYPSRAAKKLGHVAVHETNGSYVVKAAPFTEMRTAAALMKEPGAKALRRRVELLPAGAREGAKARAYVFPLRAEKP